MKCQTFICLFRVCYIVSSSGRILRKTWWERGKYNSNYNLWRKFDAISKLKRRLIVFSTTNSQRMPLHEMHYFTTSRNKSTLMNKKIESIHVQLINFHHLNLPTLSFFFHERFQFFSKCEITIYLSILIIGPLWNDICKFFRYRREYDSFLSFAFQIFLLILKFPNFL